jgi:RNA polymerase sigma factor (sigma-70 family)
MPGLQVDQDSDEDLLVFISWQEDQPDVAKAACSEFYQRHLKYMFAVIKRAFGEELGQHGVEDMVNETFIRVFEKANTYKACGESCLDRQRKNVRAWMGAIAMNLCRDHFRHPDTQLTLVDDWGDDEAARQRPREDSPTRLSDDMKCVHEAMNLLSENEQSVTRVTMAYWKADSESQRLPNDVAADLARSLDTSSENIRKIRERAMKKLRESIEACRKARRGDDS